jgi:hypothetical protein
VLVAAALVVSGCGSSSPHVAPSPSAGGTTTLDSRTLGVIALGHSGLTGLRSQPGSDADARQNSWATGTNPAVNSIYARLLAVQPAVEGHVDNEAVDGSKADVLLAEAQAALSVVPHPQLALVMTIDNDVRCDGTDASNLPVFGAQLRAAVDEVVKASPRVTVIIMTPLGRPLEAALATLRVPAAVPSLQGSGPCDMIDPKGRLNRAAVQRLTSAVDLYEREVARVCARIPQCHTDGGVGAGFTSFVSYAVPGDWNHLTIAGHTRLARLLWPTVARLLSVPAT